MSTSGPGWPGSGTLTLAAEDARAFTVHELARPRLNEVEAAISRGNPGEWLTKTADELRALVGDGDRPLVASDLKFAATARCKCGAGFCYPRFVHDAHGQWVCSAILLGTAAAGSEHDRAKPFVFWDIKGEGQPSANGATTRP